MLERAELARDDSDTSYFFELLYLGELAVKVITIEILAGLQDEPERHRHALEYRLVRANGIGEWAEVLDEAITGPPSQHFMPAARESQQALNQPFGPNADSWQRRAVLLLYNVSQLLDSAVPDVSGQRVSLRQWVRQFAWLRNRTRGHGSPRPATLSNICVNLRTSIDLVLDNAPAFRRDWSYLKRNLSGKYRVSVIGGARESFADLSRDANQSFVDGVYVYLARPQRARLLFTEPDLTDFYLPNGNFRNEVLAELARPDYGDLSSAANRLNGLLSNRELEIDADERRLMIRKLRRLMEDRNSEADATDLSRLAWLCVYDQDQPAAKRWVLEGLSRDSSNEYCLRMKRTL